MSLDDLFRYIGTTGRSEDKVVLDIINLVYKLKDRDRKRLLDFVKNLID